MKATYIYLIIFLLFVGNFSNLQAQFYKDSHNQKDSRYHKKSNIKKGLNLGFDLNFGENFYSNNFHIGYSISDKFDGNKKAYWQIGADVNWSKYSIFDSYGFSYFNHPSKYRTTSISFPMILGYQVRRSFFSRIKIYAGPVYDFIITSRLDNAPYYDIDRGQWGFTVGTKLRFLALLNAGIAYKYYPNSLFNNGDFNRSSISFSLGF